MPIPQEKIQAVHNVEEKITFIVDDCATQWCVLTEICLQRKVQLLLIIASNDVPEVQNAAFGQKLIR